MTRIAKVGRGYRSQLRKRQAEETRKRILDATVRVMARGITGASIPAVAREAGVSVPTVYRHFGTKRDLFAALYPHMVYKAASVQLLLPNSIDDFATGLRKHFSTLDSMGEMERAAIASPAGQEARRANMPGRIARTRDLARSIVSADSEVDIDRLTRLLVILTGTAAFRTWREDLGSSVEEAVGDIEWAMRARVAASERKEE